MKKIILFFIILVCISFQVSSLNISFEDSDTIVSINYFPTAEPGDAAFVRLNFEQNQSNKNISAILEFYKNNKKINSTDFYFIETENKNKTEMLAGIPLSTYLSNDDILFLKVKYKIDGKENVTSLPLTINTKKFIEEVIPLNETNTAIRTNTSKERLDQIERLNKIFATTNLTATYDTNNFITPLAADTRRSSFFGDRRTYAYSNGKKATSLHYGTDYAVPTGTKITSPAKGKVVMAENRISTGWSIVIEHLPGLYSVYYHMSKLDVEVGQIVETGQLIGLSGATGMVTGPHLHWEVRLLSEAVSPDFLVDKYIP